MSSDSKDRGERGEPIKAKPSKTRNIPYIGGDPLPRPDISDRGERGTPIKPKAHKRAHPAPKPKTIDLGKLPQPKAPSYRAPDNYSTYGRPGTNQMGPSSAPKTIKLGKLPSTRVGDIPSTGKSDFASRFGGKGTVSDTPRVSDLPSTFPAKGTEETPTAQPNVPYIGGDPLPRPKQSKHAYKTKWS